jgi:hypothetical protein
VGTGSAYSFLCVLANRSSPWCAAAFGGLWFKFLFPVKSLSFILCRFTGEKNEKSFDKVD